MSEEDNHVQECCVCLEMVPGRFGTKNMCNACAVSLPENKEGEKLDPLTQKKLECCPWCNETITGANSYFHYNGCSEVDEQVKKLNVDTFDQRMKNQMGIWREYMTLKLGASGIYGVDLWK
jgi:hypothetical protein